MAMFLLSSAAIDLLYPKHFGLIVSIFFITSHCNFFPLAWMRLSCNLIIQKFSVSTVFCFPVVFVVHLGQCTRFYDLSLQQAAKAQASLHICADSPELSLLAYTKYGCRWKFIPKYRPLALLRMSAWMFIRGISAYAISIEISCADPYLFVWERNTCSHICIYTIILLLFLSTKKVMKTYSRKVILTH